MGYLRENASKWLHRHPPLHVFYNPRIGTDPKARNSGRFQIITSPLRELPDFVIIGAQKSGTTSLYDFIVKHPDIVPTPAKELKYFSTGYRFGKLWYRSNFPTKIQRYYFYKKTKKKLLSGEASPNYLFWQAAPSRMKALLPDVKLIVILRNPVDRAYSHYHMLLRLNRESISFEKVIKLEEEQRVRERKRMITDPDYIHNRDSTNLCLANGIYVDQLENWFKYYGREKFLILTAEDLRENRQQTLDKVFDFLGVPSFQVEKTKSLNIGNYEKMSEETRKFLIEYFKPHNKRLSKLLRCSFDWDR